MPNALTTMNGAVPAHIKKAFEAAQAANSALAAGVSAGYPIVSYKGKVWHVVEGGERTLITIGEGRNANDPAASLEAVIVLANPALNKVYYPDGYEEGSTERPLCHSDDGIVPAADAQEKQAKACGVCPYNEWGSKVSDTGSRGKACADSRRMAIVPADDLESPMLLRCPAASLKTLLAYGQSLDKRGWPYHGIVTRIGFDPSLAYPALTFTPERWLDAEELATVEALAKDDLVKTITATRDAPAPTAKEDPAFARMERQAKPAEPEDEDEVEVTPTPEPEPVKKTRKRKATASADEIAAAVGEPEQPVAEEAQPDTPPATVRKGFGAKKAKAATAQAAPAEEASDPSLGDAALQELDDVLKGFDDGDDDE